MKVNMKSSSIETSINNKFKQRIISGKIDEKKNSDFDFNKSFGGMDYWKRRSHGIYMLNNSNKDNNALNKTVSGNRNNSTYISSNKMNINEKIDGKIKKMNLKQSKIPIEEEKHSSKGVIDEYTNLSYNNKTNYIDSRNKKAKQNLRFNSFNTNNLNNFKNDVNSHRTFSFEFSTNTYKVKKKDSKFKQNNNNNFPNTEKKAITKGNSKTKEKKNFKESKHEKTLSKKNLEDIYENKNKKEDDDDWNIEQYRGLRKRTININRLKRDRKNKLNEINSQFSKNIYIKSSKALSVAGKSEGGIKKVNQDSYILEKNINEVLNFNIFGVLDGHGINGHLVSQFVSRYIINRIKNHPLLKNLKNPKELYNKLRLNGYEIIANIFTEADIQLTKQTFNSENSGTTCIIVIQLEEHIICANAGDSRAIVIFDEANNKNLSNTKIYPLSFDCKPEIPMEKERIYQHGGTVEQLIDENGNGVGPFRVWVEGEDYPGLAMSRSIGDFEAKNIGVIPNPQIIEYEINYKSKYMIICSDGIWEFINNEEAMNIGNKYYLRNDPVGLCNELIQKSTEIWIKEDTVIDDITVVTAFF